MQRVSIYVRSVLVTVSLCLGIVTGLSYPVLAAPVDVLDQSCDAAGQSGSDFCANSDTPLFGAGSFWVSIVNAMIFVTSALSVIMIVIGGFRYSASGGDQSAITSAKNTILYAVIGLVVAVAAYAIVNFVLTSVIK